MSKSQFIKAMVEELGKIEDMDSPRKQSTKMKVREAYEDFGFDWQEVDSRAFSALHECLGLASKPSAGKKTEIYPWKSMPLTPRFLEGLTTANIINDGKEAQKLKAEVFGKLFFRLPLDLLQANSVKTLGPILSKWTDAGDEEETAGAQSDRGAGAKGRSKLYSCLTALVKYALNLVQNDLIDQGAWERMNLSPLLCELFVFLIIMNSSSNVIKYLQENGEYKPLLSSVCFLLRDHAIQNGSAKAVFVVKTLTVHLDDPVAKWYLVPMFGQLLSHEKIKDSVHVRGQILVELEQSYGKLNGLLKEYVAEGCPLDKTGVFMGCTSICKFVAMVTGSFAPVASSVPKLVELGFFQIFLSLASGNKGGRKKRPMGGVTAAEQAAVEIEFYEPSWIIAHNFLLWYVLNDVQAASYTTSLKRFTAILQSETYAQAKPFEAMLWAVALGVAESSGKKGGKEKVWHVKPMLETFFSSRPFTTSGVEALVNFLQKVTGSKIIKNGGAKLKSSCHVMQEISDWLRPVHKDLQRGKFVLVDDQQDKESSAPVVDGKNLVAEKKVKKADKLKSALRKQLKHFLVGKDD